MNITNFKKVLPKLLKHNVVPFLWGYQGVGKTQAVKQYAQENDLGFVHLHLATQEVGDLVGLLKHNDDGTVSHVAPEWLPKSGKGIVFLDELNRAHPDVLQAMFSFITNKTIHSHKLPDNWHIVAAGNYPSEEFTVSDTSDAAFMSRFCHIKLEPTVSEFVNYVESKGYGDIADFISEHPECLEQKRKNTFEVQVTPDRRAWADLVAPLDKEGFDSKSTAFEVISGLVGVSAAGAFLAFKENGEKKIGLKDILNNFDLVKTKVEKLTSKNEVRFDVLNKPLEEICTNVEELDFSKPTVNVTLGYSDVECNNLINYLMLVPIELVVQINNRLTQISSIVRCKEYNTIFNNYALVERCFLNLKNEKSKKPNAK